MVLVDGFDRALQTVLRDVVIWTGQAGLCWRNDKSVGHTAIFRSHFRSVRSFAERSIGHFAASEAPDFLVEDIRTFFAGLTGD